MRLVSRFTFSLCLISLFANSALAKETAHPLVRWMEAHKTQAFSEIHDAFATEVIKYADSHGAVTGALQSALTLIEKRYSSRFDAKGWEDFQEIIAKVGAKMENPIRMPKDRTPFWLLEPGKLTDYRSSDKLPTTADFVVIGAGLTGASAAYHLGRVASNGKTVLVLEEGQIASQSSGKNGGNFQLLAESYTGHYDGMVEEQEKWLAKQNPSLSKESIHKQAKTRADVLYNFNLKNYQRFVGIVQKENLACDFSAQGWLRLASDAGEDQALQRDTEWMLSLKKKAPFEMWSPKQIQNIAFLKSPYPGRFVPGNGNYHPYKFVSEILQKTISQGVKLYTKVKVNKVLVKGAEDIEVVTSEGVIHAKAVIVATNAATPKLFPELSAIHTHESQIINFEHVEDPIRGMTVTERGGDIYYNFPKSRLYKDSKGRSHGMLHFGVDFDETVAADKTTRQEPHFQEMRKLVEQRFPGTRGQPPSRAWVGPMGFTEDHVPLIGFLHPKESSTQSNNLVVAAGFQGYGGSFCVQAGYVAASMAMTGKVHHDVPEEIFSPQRFVEATKLSMQ